MTIYYLGQKGSYSHQAGMLIDSKVSTEAILKGKPSFEEILKACEDPDTAGILPVKNKIYGEIKETLNFLKHTQRFKIKQKITLEIQHCLLATKKTPLKKIKKIYGQSVALAQCQKFFSKFPDIKITAVSDSGKASEIVKKIGNENIAALAGKINSKIYGLEIIFENLTGNEKNWTEFWVFSRN